MKLENKVSGSVSEDLLDDVLIAPVVPIRSFKEEVDDVRVYLFGITPVQFIILYFS